jgi:tetrapyrrole methylase family protein / MazG family protein
VSPKVVVVGLGPAGIDLVLPAARDALERASVRYTRTDRHPAVAQLAAAGIELTSFDEQYERAGDLDEVYAGITEALVEAATSHGEVVYAVPGNPAVAERTVVLLRDAMTKGAIELDVVPGLSFAELAWGKVGVDPLDGGRVIDARDLDREVVAAGGPLLIAQCDSPFLLADVKLALLDMLPADAPVTMLQRLGLADERVCVVELADLDRDLEPDHLTTLYVEGSAAAAAREVTRLLGLARRLRGPGGCPWDAEQTHHSLTRYLLEEAYEVVEAVEADDPAALEDELGDLLYQVVFHAILAEEAGEYGMAEIARGIHDKLVRRHPHVFGDVGAETSSEVMRNWEQIKKDEKGTTSIVSGITPGLPSLLYTHKLLRKAASVGIDPGTRADSLARLAAAVQALGETPPDGDVEGQLGELLAAAVVLARTGGVDAESALRGWAARFRRRFEALERLAQDRDLDLHTLDPAEVARLFDEVAADP